MVKAAPLSAVVDELASVAANISTLQKREKELKAVLIASGQASIDGTEHKVSVSRLDGRVTVDWQSIAEKFSPSRQLVTAYTKHGEPYAVVRLSGRKVSR